MRLRFHELRNCLDKNWIEMFKKIEECWKTKTGHFKVGKQFFLVENIKKLKREPFGDRIIFEKIRTVPKNGTLWPSIASQTKKNQANAGREPTKSCFPAIVNTQRHPR